MPAQSSTDFLTHTLRLYHLKYRVAVKCFGKAKPESHSATTNPEGLLKQGRIDGMDYYY
jgi:hypothetical protein